LAGARNISFIHSSNNGSGACTEWVLRNFSTEVKRPGREPDHSLSSSVEVNNAWNYQSIHPIA